MIETKPYERRVLLRASHRYPFNDTHITYRLLGLVLNGHLFDNTKMTFIGLKHFFSQQELRASISVSGRGLCDVSFTIEPDADPERHGLGLIGLYDDLNIVKGYPIVRGTVSSPHSRAYASIYGWIQITNTPGEPWVMDNYPMFEDSTSPFMS